MALDPEIIDPKNAPLVPVTQETVAELDAPIEVLGQEPDQYTDSVTVEDFPEEPTSFFRSFGKDFMKASPAGKAAIVGGVAVVGAHLAVGDLFYGNVGVDVFNATHENFVLTGTAIAAASVAVESTSTLILSNAIDKFPTVSRWLYNRKFREDPEIIDAEVLAIDGEPVAEEKKPAPVPEINGAEIQPADQPQEPEEGKKSGAFTTASNVLFLGSPGYILQEHYRNPGQTTRDHLRNGAKAVGGLAVFNFTAITGVAAAVKYAGEIGSFADKLVITGLTQPELGGVIPKLGLLPELKSPVFFASLFALSKVKPTVKRVRNWNQGRKAKKSKDSIPADFDNEIDLQPPNDAIG